jgi:hypothetical protein
MTLLHVVEEYAAFRRTLGEKFGVNGQVLRAFCKAMGKTLPSRMSRLNE